MKIKSSFEYEMKGFIPEFSVSTDKNISILNLLQSFNTAILHITLSSEAEAYFFFMEGALFFRGIRKDNKVTDFIFVKNDKFEEVKSSYDFEGAKLEFSHVGVASLLSRWIKYFNEVNYDEKCRLINISVTNVLKTFGL